MHIARVETKVAKLVQRNDAADDDDDDDDDDKSVRFQTSIIPRDLDPLARTFESRGCAPREPNDCSSVRIQSPSKQLARDLLVTRVTRSVYRRFLVPSFAPSFFVSLFICRLFLLFYFSFFFSFFLQTPSPLLLFFFFFHFVSSLPTFFFFFVERKNIKSGKATEGGRIYTQPTKMRLLVSVLLVSVFLVACARAFPAFDSSEESDERKNVDTVVVLPKNGRDLFSVRSRPRISDISDTSDFDVDDSNAEDPDVWSFLRRSYPSMYLMYLRQSLQEMLQRLRDEMSSMASRLPSGPSFIRPWKTPEGANTTSTTKIIDGHVVTVNETTYSDVNDNEGMYIRVRVIDVKPQEETTTTPDTQGLTTTPVLITDGGESTEVTTTPARSVETVEEFDNNIPQTERDPLTA